MKKGILLLVFDLVSTFGSEIFFFACSFYILRETSNGTLYGFVIGMMALVQIVLGPIMGNLADYKSNRKMIFYCTINKRTVHHRFFSGLSKSLVGTGCFNDDAYCH